MEDKEEIGKVKGKDDIEVRGKFTAHVNMTPVIYFPHLGSTD